MQLLKFKTSDGPHIYIPPDGILTVQSMVLGQNASAPTAQSLMRFMIGQGLTAAFVTARASDTVDQIVCHPSGTKNWLKLTTNAEQLFFLRSSLITGVSELNARPSSHHLRARVHYNLGLVHKYVDVTEVAEQIARRAGEITVVPVISEPRRSFVDQESMPKLH
jgi:hypothetical protein